MPSKTWTAAVVLTGLAALAGAMPAGATPNIRAQTRLFLDAYARGDRATLLRLVDGDAVTIYGSDADEIFRGRAGIAIMLDNDRLVWAGSARIGPMEHVSVIERDGLATIFFDADFSLRSRPKVPVRFAMVWRRSRGEWRLVQSSNVVPTEHQSAALLLRSRRPH
jgi:ketosteroid isomerase-like protein